MLYAHFILSSLNLSGIFHESYFLSPNKAIYKTRTATVMEWIITYLSFHNVVFIAYHEVYNEYKIRLTRKIMVTSKANGISRVII